MRWFRALSWAVLITVSAGAQAGGRVENHFGSLFVDGRKAGQIHYTVEYGEGGDIETLRTRASLSILGVKLFNFEQNLHEYWRRGELEQMTSRTEDDGKLYSVALFRESAAYKATLNGKPVELPAKAFPASVWHYAIVRQSLLFDLMALKPLKVKVARGEDTLELRGRKLTTERFEFSGDWKATVWFDDKKQLVKFEYPVQGHTVRVQLDD
ncbi:MAG: DUF6134 family protein [Burkholderiales bacterium]|nr:DUF6134 family protein [Burkholderiales bacterium]